MGFVGEGLLTLPLKGRTIPARSRAGHRPAPTLIRPVRLCHPNGLALTSTNMSLRDLMYQVEAISQSKEQDCSKRVLRDLRIGDPLLPAWQEAGLVCVVPDNESRKEFALIALDVMKDKVD